MGKTNKREKSLLQFEIEFFEKLLADNPDFVDALLPLAEAYTKRGDYHKGLAVDKRLSRLKNDDAVVYYNLACSYSLTNRIKAALNALEKAINLGYRDFERMDSDEDLVNVRNDLRYAKMMRRWKKGKGVLKDDTWIVYGSGWDDQPTILDRYDRE